MNSLRLVAHVLFVIAWIGALCAWCVGAYHFVMASPQFWKSKPSTRQILSNMVWFQQGWISLFSAIDNAPVAVRAHRRKARQALLVFLGFWAIGMCVGFAGVFWGNWNADQ